MRLPHPPVSHKATIASQAAGATPVYSLRGSPTNEIVGEKVIATLLGDIPIFRPQRGTAPLRVLRGTAG